MSSSTRPGAIYHPSRVNVAIANGTNNLELGVATHPPEATDKDTSAAHLSTATAGPASALAISRPESSDGIRRVARRRFRCGWTFVLEAQEVIFRLEVPVTAAGIAGVPGAALLCALSRLCRLVQLIPVHSSFHGIARNVANAFA